MPPLDPDHFGFVFETLGGLRAPFMTLARIAATRAEAQIKELIGSGPFIFARDEWQRGRQAVYLRNPSYVPRDEPPSSLFCMGHEKLAKSIPH